jgi:hypothetical protein
MNDFTVFLIHVYLVCEYGVNSSEIQKNEFEYSVYLKPGNAVSWAKNF